MKVSKKFLVLFIIGIGLTAFLGILAGNYLSSRKTQPAEINPSVNQIAFEPGDRLPNAKLKNLAGEEINLHNLISNKKSILLFLTIGNSMCEEELSKWMKFLPKLSSNYTILGIFPEPLNQLQSYQIEKNINFTILNDPLAVFVSKNKITSFPTVIGVNRKQKVVFIHTEYFTGTTPQDFLKKF